jgi:hypothetical protein
LFKKGEIICMCKSMQLDGLNSNFFWPQRDYSFWIENNNVLLLIRTLSTEACKSYEISTELLFQIEKKNRSRCSHWPDINHTLEWNLHTLCFKQGGNVLIILYGVTS